MLVYICTELNQTNSSSMKNKSKGKEKSKDLEIPSREEQVQKFTDVFDRVKPVGVISFMETDEALEGYANGNFSTVGLQAMIDKATELLKAQLMEQFLDGLSG